MIPNAPVAMACALSALVGTAAASTGQPRYDVAQVVRVEPIVEYTTYPVQREHCYQQPETVVAYAQPYPPAYPPAYAGPSYGIGVSYGGYGGHGHGHGYGHRGHGRGGGYGGSSFQGSYYAGGYGGNGERVLGAIAGGVLGNQFGHGGGRVAATFFGAVLGDALVADYQRSSGYAGAYGGGYAAAQPVSQQVVYHERCEIRTEYIREAPATRYDVTYRYQGHLYHIRTPFDPGESIRVRVDNLPL